MLEVCFSDSVKETIKIAQTCGDKVLGGAVGVITSGSRNKLQAYFQKRKAIKRFWAEQEELQKQAVPLGGNRDDVLEISFYLCEGDIAAPIEVEHCPRKDLIVSLWTFNPYEDLQNAEKSALRHWQNAVADMERLKQGADQVRIWVDQTPETYCGLLFVADLLAETETELHVVPLPKNALRYGSSTVEYRSWGEVSPELFGTFLKHERALSKEETRSLSAQWKKLQSENAPLRVVAQDRVISADVDYYDSFIRNEFPKDSCKVAVLIGNALSRREIPVGDVFIAKRIEAFIQNGELETIGGREERFYSTMIKAKSTIG